MTGAPSRDHGLLRAHRSPTRRGGIDGDGRYTSSVQPVVQLWDIDGTLISAAGAGRRALEGAFLARFGAGSFLEFPFDGMTDPAIIAWGMRAAGVSEQDLPGEAQAMMAAYLASLRATCAAASDFRVHPGVAAALQQAAGRPEVALGLGTGNVAEGARLKLERVALAGHFGFGGYGDDSADRPTLLRIGAQRGADRLGVPLERCRVVVIGDTPRDVAAARAIGAECIAVATGNFAAEALRALQPTHAFPTLDDPGALAALFGPPAASRSAAG
jgi:phosphoglycolate phosphatase